MFWTFSTARLRSSIFTRAYTPLPSSESTTVSPTSSRSSQESLHRAHKDEHYHAYDPDSPSPSPDLCGMRERPRRWSIFVLVAGVAVFVLVCSAAGSYHLVRYMQDEDGPSSHFNHTAASPTAPPDLPTENLGPGAATQSKQMDPHDLLPVALDSGTHVLLPPKRPKPRRPLHSPIPRLPYSVLDTYFSTGLLPRTEIHPTSPPLDIVYLWVNATEGYFHSANQHRLSEEGLATPRGMGKRWRENGELEYAIKSAVHAFNAESESGSDSGRQQLRGVHVISSDYPVRIAPIGEMQRQEVAVEIYDDAQGSGVDGWTVGQIPHWFDWATQDRWHGDSDDTDNDGQEWLRWHFHSEIYHLPQELDNIPKSDLGLETINVDAVPLGSDIELEEVDEDLEESDDRTVEEHWRDIALPTFNSFGIETRISWVEGLSENFIISNDDMFFLTPFSASDFHHPLLGTSLRMDFSGTLAVHPVLRPELLSSPGEWGGLQHASLLLARRFTRRPKPYPAHLPKAMSLSLVDEVSTIWAEDLGLAATRGFRESRRGRGDIEMAALVGWLRFERWREALLWIWIVGKIGGQDGVWDTSARQAMVDLLGEQIRNDAVIVERGERKTLWDAVELTANVGWAKPKNSIIQFSSLDGHVPVHPDHPATRCLFASTCLPPDFFTNSTQSFAATDVFKRITFLLPECGDCLITALITASGKRGMSAILPDEGTFYQPPTPASSSEGPRAAVEPILPMTKSWQDTNFTIHHVVQPYSDLFQEDDEQDDVSAAATADGTGTGAVDMRKWSIKLLSRYLYTLSSTPAMFAQAHSTQQLNTQLGQLDRYPEVGLLCVNDDLPDGKIGVEMMMRTFKATLGRWMRGRWGTVQVPWEE